MKFYVLGREKVPPTKLPRPFATLTTDRWNDFGYQTLFDLTYYPSAGINKELGGVKIASTADKNITSLPSDFTALPESFFSLGQSMSYYERIRQIPKQPQRELLLGLRDIVYQPEYVTNVINLPVFRTSLLRFSEAEKAYREAGYLFRDEPPQESMGCSFQFSVQLRGAGTPHVLSVVLGNNPKLPDRIMALIGKNGTGKTWLLGQLAAALSGDDVRVGKFEPVRPAFQRVIAVSYSAFDRFNKPTKKRTFSYYYCGVYGNKGELYSRPRLFRKIKEAAGLIIEQKRRALWEEMVKAVLDTQTAAATERYLFDSTPEQELISPPKVSSGQLVLLSTITELTAAMKDESMILFDEPELHQHPNAIAGLMAALSSLLEQFKSFAIIATHSPLVVQQIPSVYVRMFTRIGNATVIREPVSECFGENLTTITQQMFQTSSSPSLYQDWFKQAVTDLGDTEIQQLFPKGLSFNALSVMESMKNT
jgi:predicted ATPase